MTGTTLATTGGDITGIDEEAVQELQRGLRGPLLRPTDESYDTARRVWNGMVDHRPGLIARCASTADVLTCVRFAREHELLVSVRGGGHNYAGKSVCQGGLMIDLAPMKGIRVDPAAQTVRAEPGVKLGEFDHETQHFGLATTLGVNTDTGIAGLTLGGGYGWLGGRFGLACDNLLTVDIVTAEGTLVTASARENPDLFWGVRGAGANFGVITSFEYRLHQLGPVLGGMVLYPLRAEALAFCEEFAATSPDEATCVILLLQTPDGIPAVGMAVCYSGPVAAGERVLAPLRSFGPPLADLIAPRPYTQMQTLFDAAWPPGRLYYDKSSIVRRLPRDAVTTFIEYADCMPTPLSAIAFQQLHGAAARVGASETAFPHRYDHLSCYVHPVTEDPADVPGMIDWARSCWQSVQPFVEPSVYVNALDDPEQDDQRARDAYGPNYPRLVDLKRKYDPTNFFRLNGNVSPFGT